MRFVTIAIFAVTGRLVALAAAKPVPSWRTNGIAIPLARHTSSLNSNRSIDLDAISSHGIFVREKILSGLDNYEINTGTIHPFAVKRSESRLGTRDASVPLTNYQGVILMAEISIGTPPKILTVQIDTGAADMWVVETGCHGIPEDRAVWDPELSESAEDDGLTFRLEYGDGSVVKGSRYADNVTIAGFTADPQTFGSALSYTSKSERYAYPAQGLLGLAFPSVSRFRAAPLFESLVRQKKLINPTFSLKLTSSGAEMYVGGANSQLYKGDIVYTHVTYPGLWQASMDDVRVNGNKIFENVPVIFDTGTTYILGDWNRVAELYRRVGGTLKDFGIYGYYYLPCNSFPTVSLTFGGKTFKIPPETLILEPVEKDSPNCFSTIIAHHDEYWSIGVTFLQGVYSVFDYSTMQIGFAELV